MTPGWLRAARWVARGLAACALLLSLQGCAALKAAFDNPPMPTATAQPGSAEVGPVAAAQAAASAASPAADRQGVRVEIDAPGNLKALLESQLDLVRFGHLAREDIADTEWSRLIDSAPAQVRDLLQTEGYFNPQVRVERRVAAAGELTDVVQLKVDAGPQAVIERVTIEAEGELEREARGGDPQARAVLARLTSGWELAAGMPFRNPSWSAAKAAALARLRASGYATANWTGTKADVDAGTNQVRLFLVVDSGPLFRFGELVVEGLVRQDLETVRNLVALHAGSPVTDAVVLDFQERLQKSGLFETISVVLDADPSQAAHARINVRVREYPLQTYTVGLGVSANTGPRASVEQVYRRVFGFAALARNKVEFGKLRKAWDGDISTHAALDLYRNFVGAAVEQLTSSTDTVLSQRVRVGRAQDGQRIERSLYLQGERSVRKTLDETVRTNAIATSVNYTGVWRELDSLVLPTQGWSFNGQVALGQSHGSNAVSGPFSRLYLRLTGYQPLGRSGWYSQGRVEFGQVLLRPGGVVPEPEQFRAGGDDSVRGYAYRSLGPLVDGAVGSGNVLYTVSTELAHNIVKTIPDLWGAVFIDAGNAADTFNQLHPAVGMGVGVRWRSPVGPLRLDWAYGREVHKTRIHFSVGITF
jgi:translocation and assembly module TamA